MSGSHYSGAGYGGAANQSYQPNQYPGQNNGQYAPPPGYSTSSFAQPQPQYQSTPPVLRNPFAAPPTAAGAYPGVSGEQQAPELDETQAVAQWHAAYGPAVEQNERGGRRGGRNGGVERANANFTPVGPRPPGVADVPTVAAAAATTVGVSAVGAGEGEEQRKTVVRKGGGQTWEDKTLLEWDPTHFRIMVGNLAGEVTDESLAKAFAAYGVSKARVVRDKVTTKSRGFGFVSFFEGEDGFKAAREMVGKYIGSHPVTIQRSKTDLRPVTQKKDDRRNHKNKGRNNNNKNRDNRADDPLKANTGAGVEKKPAKVPSGLKVLG